MVLEFGWNGKRGACLRDFILAEDVAVEIVLRHLDVPFFMVNARVDKSQLQIRARA